MTEQICAMISQASALFRTVMLAFVFMGLWNRLIETRFRKRKVLLFIEIVIYLIMLDAIAIPAFIRYITVFLICVVYCLVFKICKWEKPAFLLLYLYNLHTMAFLVANSFYQLLIKSMNDRLDMTSPDVVEKIYLHAGILQIVFMILYAIILLLLFLVFSKLKLKLEELSFAEFIFLSVLNVVGIILAYMVVKLMVVPLENDVFILYDEVSDFLWEIPIIAVLLLIGEYSSIYVFCQYKKILVERESVIVRQQQLKQLQYRFEEAQLLYGNLRSLRHDMKNHMQTIQGLVAAGESKKATEYVGKLNDAIEEIDCKYCTGNTLCDVVLNDKYRQAKRDNIEMSVDFKFVHGILDFDMGIILSNLCDNAIEACRELPVPDRRVELSLLENGPCVLITVTNPYAGEIVFDREDGFPVSDKYDVTGKRDDSDYIDKLRHGEHGIGLHNVAAIADSYLGSMQIDVDNNLFSVTVMLQKKVEEGPVAT